MKIKRQFTTAGKCAYQDINFTSTSSEIKNPDGSIVFQLDNVEVPTNWSQVASDVIDKNIFVKQAFQRKLRKLKKKMYLSFYGDRFRRLIHLSQVKLLPSRFLTVLQEPGLTGAGRADILPTRKMPKPISMK